VNAFIVGCGMIQDGPDWSQSTPKAPQGALLARRGAVHQTTEPSYGMFVTVLPVIVTPEIPE
jgi:hypothetical protein